LLASNRPTTDDSPVRAVTPEVIQALVESSRGTRAEHGHLDCHCTPPGKASC
jgi:hypothetical protein